MSTRIGPPPAATVLTGATGWLGSAIVAQLTDAAHAWHRSGPIRALVRDRVEGDRLRALSDAIEPVVGDIRERPTLDRLFDGLTDPVDAIHTAGVIHPGDVAEFFAVNTEGTRLLLDAAHRHRVRRVVHVSSNSPFGTNSHAGDRFRHDEPYDPYLGYGRSKMEAELAVFDAVAAGLDAVIVRPPWFYGPYQPPRQTTFFTMVRKGLFPVFGGGGQMRSMVYVDNLVQGVLRAELCDAPAGSAWWVADDRPYDVVEIVETVGRALAAEGYEVSPNRLRLPDIVGRMAERADAAIQRSGRYHQQIHVLGEMNKHIACDVSRTRRELGYEPEIELYEGMRRSIRWCRDQGLRL